MKWCLLSRLLCNLDVLFFFFFSKQCSPWASMGFLLWIRIFGPKFVVLEQELGLFLNVILLHRRFICQCNSTIILYFFFPVMSLLGGGREGLQEFCFWQRALIMSYSYSEIKILFLQLSWQYFSCGYSGISFILQHIVGLVLVCFLNPELESDLKSSASLTMSEKLILHFVKLVREVLNIKIKIKISNSEGKQTEPYTYFQSLIRELKMLKFDAYIAT